MRSAVPPTTPEDWFRHLFSAKAALDGGIVRRKVKDMELMVGRDRFLAEIERRGYTAIENAGQVVVFCNRDRVRVIARARPNFLRKFAPKPSARV